MNKPQIDPAAIRIIEAINALNKLRGLNITYILPREGAERNGQSDASSNNLQANLLEGERIPTQ